MVVNFPEPRHGGIHVARRHGGTHVCVVQFEECSTIQRKCRDRLSDQRQKRDGQREKEGSKQTATPLCRANCGGPRSHPASPRPRHARDTRHQIATHSLQSMPFGFNYLWQMPMEYLICLRYAANCKIEFRWFMQQQQNNDGK